MLYKSAGTVEITGLRNPAGAEQNPPDSTGITMLGSGSRHQPMPTTADRPVASSGNVLNQRKRKSEAVPPAINCSQGRCCSHVESVGIKFSGDVSRDFSAIDRRVEVMDRSQSSTENYLEHAIISSSFVETDIRLLEFCNNCGGTVDSRGGLRQLKIDQAILACLRFIISSDSASDAPPAPIIWWANSSWDLPADLSKHLTHWSQLSTEWDTHKTLGIIADSHEMRNGIIRAASKLLSSAGGESNTVLVDVSQTRTIFWPLVRSLGERVIWGSSHMTRARSGPFSISIIISELVRALFIRPVNRIYKALAKGVKKNKKDADDVNLERGQPAREMPRTTFIGHGVRDTEQANELWTLVDQVKDKLKTRFKSLGIVIVSEPVLLRHNSEDERLILDYFCTMHVSETFVLYSGVSPTPPVLCENLFLLFADGVHRIGGSKAERLWPKVLKL
ncbi:hypothetical protein B0H14DRAFT_3128811 [Mycena olivaceomarginata]|nr:hypothetical protein B0H14DRAFT_3128811 [Mycena olivaceomarginata]